MLEFVKTMVAAFQEEQDLNGSGIQVAMVTYSDEAKIDITFKKSNELADAGGLTGLKQLQVHSYHFLFLVLSFPYY